ncbi:MAG: ABC transporter ATP-binding protein [Candidatus Caldarchaeum sp.]|nr:ABC transporter ATP-binding protein [Candidatus Caldarchaeum sp.]MDW8436267.1 ABC transporter ATP-binding protein [Candidatus Caldarchaeum sp.]
MLQLDNIRKSFTEPVKKITELFSKQARRIYAVDGVSLKVGHDEVLGIVGESGSGKSTLAKTVARIYEPDEGKIIFMGEDITHISHKKLLEYRKKIQMVFQNPYSSLNPRRKVKDIIGDVMRLHGLENDYSVNDALRAVGLDADYGNRYPHQLSGGERQRVAIARALALRPSLIIADEITSSLDASTQMQILNLLRKIRREHSMSMMFISHDLAVVNSVSDNIAVMYGGKVVEQGSAYDIISKPLHPYSQALIESVPDPYRGWNPKIADVENRNPATGCKFASRCPYASNKCYEKHPPFIHVSQGRKVACYLYE